MSDKFKPKAESVLKTLSGKGHKLRIVWGKRTKAENDVLVEKGRASATSKHLTGDGMDFINRSIGYDIGKTSQYYKDLEQATKDAGVEWGGNWSDPWDPNHVELK